MLSPSNRAYARTPKAPDQDGRVKKVADKLAVIDPEKSNARKQPSSTGVQGAAGRSFGGSAVAGIVQRFQMNPGLVSHAEVLTLQRTIGNRAVGQLLRRANQGVATPLQRLSVTGAHSVAVQRDPDDPDPSSDADAGPTPISAPGGAPLPSPDVDAGPPPTPDADVGPTSSPDADVGPTSGPDPDVDPTPTSDTDAGPTPSSDPDSDGIDPSDKGADPEDAEDAKKWGGERGLTPEETGDARDIYQDSLDFSKVTIAGHSALSSGATRTIGNTIYFEDDEFDSNTSTLTPVGRSTLIHELGHVWQYQHGGLDYIPNALGAQAAAVITTGERGNAYKWRDALDQGRPWAEWNAEQQAEAIQAYHDAKRRIAAKEAEPADDETVKALEPYIGQVRNGLGAPGGPSQAPGDYPEGDPNRPMA